MELTAILAPFECPLCERMKITLPLYCEKKGWKLIMMEDYENNKELIKNNLTINYYPFIIIKEDMGLFKDTVIGTIDGVNEEKLMNKLNKY